MDHSPTAENYSDLFAYQYKPKEGDIVKQSSGWALFDSQSEYGRMGVPNKHWRPTSLNSNYEVSWWNSTLKLILIVIVRTWKEIFLGNDWPD